MDFATYAHRAVRLVNQRLDDLADLRSLLADSGWERVLAPSDLDACRLARGELREVFALADAGRDADTVAALNRLLETYPVRPWISGHDRSDWHLHVLGAAPAPSAEYVAGAVWGLAVALCTWGSDRFGLCADERCGNAYLDTSTNRSRRYCSDRCATRAHVAAHRARARSGTPAR